MIMRLFGDAQLFMKAQGVADVFYILKRNSTSSSDEVQQTLCNFCEIVQPVSLTATGVPRACSLGWNDLEDCLISVAGVKIGADYIVSRNTSDFARSSVPMVTPAQLMQFVSEKNGVEYEELIEACPWGKVS